ncbi:ELM1/GtrOC1 family putative glycosyltransferase [Coraliomargarita sp. SDUM461003]|uniref:ELM1/GtrOC1 family putative glycosyltransferase n=1 Tax=Thalassobacterium maritimum TaxID=3041265 RepID=A0ABU1AYF4_9BACT|nr:ELM1/GtrOC1 family putative glycosyltransferase [Coraliomargarita sp. SDUM461003]MDQ8209172.1 ELM1/GtrOC1 family putative glycosyltransferase [Coraliomargarita sp. SDUM461003]
MSILKCILKGDLPELTTDDVVIAKTAPFEFVSYLITAGTGAKILFVGHPKRLDVSCFDWIVATPSTPSSAANIKLELLPGSFTPEEFATTRVASDPTQCCYGFLVGGSSRGYPFCDSDWDALIDLISAIREYDDSAVWSISTSPRTDPYFEDQLKALRTARPELFSGVFLWNEGERANVLEVLQCSSLVFVTEDSASMLCEALSTGLPVLSLRPEASTFHSLSTPLSDFHEEKGRLMRFKIKSFRFSSTRDFEVNYANLSTEHWTDSLRRQFFVTVCCK